MFENFDFGKGVMNKYIDFNIDEMLGFEEQCYSYKQDMLQISYEKNYVLDIGWYPEFHPNGCFTIRVIKDYNWQKPLFIKSCRKIKTLLKHTEKFVVFIQADSLDC